MYDTSPKGTGTRQGRYVSSQLLPPTCRLRLQSMPMEWYGPKPSGNQACKYHRPVDPGISSIQGASHRPIYICRCMYEYAPMYEERTVGSTRPMYPDIVGIRNYSCSRYSTSEKLHWHTCFVKIASSAPFTGGYVRLAATRAFVFELRAFFRRENIRELGQFLRTPHAKICYDCRAIFFFRHLPPCCSRRRSLQRRTCLFCCGFQLKFLHASNTSPITDSRCMIYRFLICIIPQVTYDLANIAGWEP